MWTFKCDEIPVVLSQHWPQEADNSYYRLIENLWPSGCEGSRVGFVSCSSLTNEDDGADSPVEIMQKPPVQTLHWLLGTYRAPSSLWRPLCVTETTLESSGRMMVVCLTCTPVSDVHLSVPICTLPSQQLYTWYIECQGQAWHTDKCQPLALANVKPDMPQTFNNPPCWTNSEPRSSNRRGRLGGGWIRPASGYEIAETPQLPSTWRALEMGSASSWIRHPDGLPGT